MSNLLLQPNQVHTLSEVVYETDMMFRNVRKWNPEKSIEQVQQISSARMQSFLTSKQQPLKAEGLNLFHAKSGIFNIDLLSGFGFVAHGTGSRANELVLVTRGTNFQHNKFDLATNANIGYGIGPRGNVFHRGFLKTFKSYQNQLVNFVTHSGAKRPTTIHCMGHSLGGALANLNACMLRDPVPMVPVFPYAHASNGPSELLVQQGEKVGIDAHLLHSGYSKMTHSSSWSDFTPMPHFLSNHADLAKEFARIGGGNMFNTKLLELIGKLTKRVLLDMGYVYLVTTQGALSMAFTAVDLLAEVLAKAVNKNKLLAGDVHTIVNSMLGFLGRPVMNGTDITVSTLHWVLGQFSTEMAGRAEQAMLKAQKRG